jgi:hypothetical protein
MAGELRPQLLQHIRAAIDICGETASRTSTAAQRAHVMRLRDFFHAGLMEISDAEPDYPDDDVFVRELVGTRFRLPAPDDLRELDGFANRLGQYISVKRNRRS